MSSTQTQSEVVSSNELPWAADELMNRLANDLCTIDAHIIGKLLTLIETLGFDDKREKAIKDTFKQSIRQVLEQTGASLDDCIKSIRQNGVNKDDKSIDMSFSSLRNYLHWRSDVVALN